MRWFRTPEEFRAESHPFDKPLAGLRVALDPGHIGGPWAQMEGRSTRYNGSAPVQEGDLNLITGRLLKAGTDQSRRHGLRSARFDRAGHSLPPGRHARPRRGNFSCTSQRIAASCERLPADKLNLLFGQRVMELAEFLFYRCSEIMERGNRIRNNFVPDITITLYIDATPGSGRGRLTSGNANIFFVHGSYTRSEMADPAMQRRCVYKMVEGSSEIEKEVAADIAGIFTQRTGLGPVKYGDSSHHAPGFPEQSVTWSRAILPPIANTTARWSAPNPTS